MVMISDFRHDAGEICALLGYYAAWNGNPLLTIQCCVISQKSTDLNGMIMLKECEMKEGQNKLQQLKWKE
jgi:hypothetical protein